MIQRELASARGSLIGSWLRPPPVKPPAVTEEYELNGWISSNLKCDSDVKPAALQRTSASEIGL